MKTILSNMVSVIGNEETKSYGWKELLMKLGALIIAVYVMVAIDMAVYGFITGKL